MLKLVGSSSVSWIRRRSQGAVENEICCLRPIWRPAKQQNLSCLGLAFNFLSFRPKLQLLTCFFDLPKLLFNLNKL